MFERKKKEIKGTEIVKGISETTFLFALNKHIKDFQENGYEVDVQYAEPYHALVLAYEVK